MKAFQLCALLLTALGLTAPGCRKSPTQPSSPAPATSTLTFVVAPGQLEPADSGTYTTANATFAASVRTTCVPDPNISNSVCPDLMASVDGTDGRLCSMWAFAPVGRTLGVGSYPKASNPKVGVVPSADTAAFFFNCGRAGTNCGENTSAFTIHELQSSTSGVVTRLHMTFEQTCLGGYPPAVGPFGKGTGELWIVDGTTPFP